jgi:hypothetical protein
MGVMAPRSSCPGEEATPLRGDSRHPVQRKLKTLSQLSIPLPGPKSFSPVLRARLVGPTRVYFSSPPCEFLTGPLV